MAKKIYLHLSGGIGNQLFQYAVAKNLSIIHNAELILDKSTGFITDLKYKRKFSLRHIKFNKVRFSNVFLFLIFRIVKKIFSLKKLFYKFFFINIIDEYYSFDKFHNEIKNLEFKKLYMLGLFQSEKYFEDNKDNIIEEIFPKKPNEEIYNNEALNIDDNSIAICIRAFEDVPKKLSHTVGGFTDYSFFEKALKKFLEKNEKPKIYFFSTNNKNISKLVENVKLLQKFESKVITKETGYTDDLNTLWLITKFKKLIISNSTFYWWGAYFASTKYENAEVISSSKFPNKDTNLEKWIIL